jgi:hypothetical protein
MKTGLPSHFTVSWVPGSTPETSTMIDASACTSAEGFIWLTSGQTAAPVATAPAPAVA